MKFFALTRRKMIYIVLSIVVLSVLVFFYLEFKGLPNCRISNTQEATNVFMNYFEGVTEILKPYGLQCEPLEINEDEYNYRVATWAHLDNGASLHIELDYSISGAYSPQFFVYLYGTTYTDGNKCYLNLELYPYMYDIAAYLSSERFSSTQYQTYLTSVQDKVKKRLESGEEIPIDEQAYLRSAFSHLGLCSYGINTDENMYYPRAGVIMFLYD